MKKLIYSTYFKLAAAILCIACAAFSVQTIARCFINIASENEVVYEFEKNAGESHHLNFLLKTPQAAVDSAYERFYSSHPSDTADKSELYNLISSQLDEIDKNTDYYITADGYTFTDCGESESNYFSSRKYFIIYEKKSGSNRFVVSESNIPQANNLYMSSDIPKSTSITICSALNDDYAAEYTKLWNNQFDMVKKSFYVALIALIISLFSVAFLTCVCGRDENNAEKSMWIDNIFTELHFLIIAASLSFGVFLNVVMISGNIDNDFPKFMVLSLVPVISCVAASVALICYLAIIRMIKHGKFLRKSFLYRFAALIVRYTKKICRKAKKIYYGLLDFKSNKLGGILIAMLIAYTMAVIICGIMFPKSLFFIIAVFLAAAFIIDIRAKESEKIRQGAEEIRSGNISYKIPELKCNDLDNIAKNINEIGTGLNQSLESRLKAERMKTELITNVSHDLKTPLTSIISYTKLLSDMDNLPSEVMDYIKIISQKSERLKNLTQDLFDISKVQSGNEDIKSEKIDAAILINQTLGEHDAEIKSSGFEFVLNIPKELYIYADGRKMSRVIGNLIENILKYSQKDTRVFVSAYEKSKKIFIELKNISSYPMDFNPDDITERFVRGDKSRTEDGSGLGLAIAKSYTEACGGTFKIEIDGDMFKAIIIFDKLI